MSDALVDAYRDLRGRVLDMTADLPAEEAERIVPCCPEWSVRDLLCHMAGVPADIVAGNTAEAATVAWADAHVSNRAGWDLERIRAELDDAGRQVDEVIAAVGERFPGPFFIDAWSHEADLAHALGLPGPTDLRMVDHVLDFLVDAIDQRMRDAGIGPVTLIGLGEEQTVGAGTTEGATGTRIELHTSRFEFARITMGRRSLAQLAALDWRGIDGAIAGPHLVVWSPNESDIVEDEPATT